MNVLEKILEEMENRVNFRKKLVIYEEKNGTITDAERNREALEELVIVEKIIRSHMDEIISEMETVEKEKVTSAEIISRKIDGKPYYEIKFKKVGEDEYTIGYSSFKLYYVVKWLNDYFEFCGEAKVSCENGGWIPVEERLPEDDDMRFYMCIVENHEEDLPMFCQYDSEYGFGFWHDFYDPVSLGFLDTEFRTNDELGYEKVIAWQPLPEPYRPKCKKTSGEIEQSVWYVEKWYDEDLINALKEIGVTASEKNLERLKSECSHIFDDKSIRNEILVDKAREIFKED